MIYFDTSFLVPLVLQEPTSQRIETLIGQLDTTQFTISQWVRVEFSSVLARAVRMGRLEAKAALRADMEFESKMDASLTVIMPNLSDYELAKRYLLRFETGLRPGAAFHLAIANNNRADTIYSLDHAMVSAGLKLGLPTTGLPIN